MKNIIVIFLFLQVNLAFTQINGDFEIWSDTTYANAYSAELASQFSVADPKGGILNHWMQELSYGISQTTDCYSGNYAVILHNWYIYIKEKINYRDSIKRRPRTLQGFYKYNTTSFDGISQGFMSVTLTRFNGITTDTIGYGAVNFDSTLTYTPFQINIQYTTASMPDSVSIYVINSKSSCLNSHICNLLYLDNLTFSEATAGTEDINFTDSTITVFPDPTSSEINIVNPYSQPVQFTLYNCLGEKIMEKSLENTTNMIDLSDLPKLVYLYQIRHDNHLISCGKIIQQ